MLDRSHGALAATATTSHDPRDGSVVATIPDTSPDAFEALLTAATDAAPRLASVAPSLRAGWLGVLADALEERLADLVTVADRETALGRPRLEAEVRRTAAQLRFYGGVAADGGYLRATLDRPSDTAPALSRCAQPLGPVAVFGSSNFPFAFGILGNDSASALAAGCPVIAKAHPAHAATCVLLDEIAVDALDRAGAPAGSFGTAHGFAAGPALVRAPQVRAVGFTGSQSGGLTLWRIANEREEVIPFFAEMGTVNPVVVTPAAASSMADIATGFVDSFTLGAGQFCTKPGLLLAPAGHGAAAAVGTALAEAAPSAVMLTEQIAVSVASGLDALMAAGGRVVARVDGDAEGWAAPAAVLSAPAAALQQGSRLLEECFGPVALIVEYASTEELDQVLDTLQGCLAAAVFTGGDTDPDAAGALARLAKKAGRVTVGDWPTGVAWTWGQHHGGPWPATTRPEATSVGAAALDRFTRPVTFQSAPAALLPSPYREIFAAANPWGLPRRVDGELVLR